MTTTETMTVRLPTDVKGMLAQLALGLRRSKSFLASEAICAYVEQEKETIRCINAGMRDVREGRSVPHEEAMKRFHATIKKNARSKK